MTISRFLVQGKHKLLTFSVAGLHSRFQDNNTTEIQNEQEVDATFNIFSVIFLVSFEFSMHIFGKHWQYDPYR